MKRSLLVLLLALCSRTFAQPEAPLVLTALAPVHELAEPLLAGTSVELQLLPDTARTMQAQLTLFTRQAERYAETFARADAVISIGRLWTADPLYTTARQFNIRVVALDASKPWSHQLDGVSVANSPVTNAVSPYFWLSPSNVIRMLDIIGTDLQRLYPADAATIKGNLEREKAAYLQLKADFENRFSAIDDPFVYALADEFVYLTSDVGLFVEDYFVKQDIDWTTEDYANLTQAIADSGVRVVIHKWDPAAEITRAITEAGATLVVLDTLETSTDFRAGLQQNLDSLLTALEQP
ncbi:MAG TPA: zinc ABC transporter substrate-binding protein [Pseudomonadales bacterium]